METRAERKYFKILPVDVNEIPLQDIVDLIKDSIPEEKKRDLTIVASGMIKDQTTNASRHRFEFKVIKDLNSVLTPQNGEEHLIVSLGKVLLNNTYNDKNDQEHIEDIFKLALSVPNKYIMVTLIGEAIAKKDILCIAALLGIRNGKGLYITHLAVSDQVFSKNKFGQRGDSKPFQHRGIAQLTVAVAQAFLRCLHKTNDMYVFSSYTRTDGESLWDKLHFVREISLPHWPEEIIELIEEYSLRNFTDLCNNHKLVPYFTSAPVRRYAVFGYLIDSIYDEDDCIFFRPPFFHWPTFHQDELSNYKDYQLAAYCMHETPEAEKVMDTLLYSRDLAKILLDIFRFRKRMILDQENHFKQNSDLRNLLDEGCTLPSIAIDYANMVLMLSHDDIYTISTDTVKRLCESGFDEAFDDFKKEFPNIKSDFDLIKEQCENKLARFIFPYLDDSKQWYNIVRIWLENCIIFLFSDCTDETMDEYEVMDEEDEDSKIPISVLWPFMNSPLWPLGVKAYWIRVPNIKEVEAESGARCFLHGYMMAKCPGHAAFHLELLRLHELGEDLIDLNMQCRFWIHDIMLYKKFFVPTLIQNIMENKVDPFPYSLEWLDENCFTVVVENFTKYQEFGDEVRDEREANRIREENRRKKGDRIRAQKSREREETIMDSSSQNTTMPLLPQPEENNNIDRAGNGFSMAMVAATMNNSITENSYAVVLPAPTIPDAAPANLMNFSLTIGNNGTDCALDNSTSLPPIGELASIHEVAASAEPLAAGSTLAESCEEVVIDDSFMAIMDECNTSTTTAESVGGEHDDVSLMRVTKYYDTVLPITSEGLMILLVDLKDPTVNIKGLEGHRDIGYSTVFSGYRKHRSGSFSIAEKDNLIRNVGDIIVALNDSDMRGVAFDDVVTMLTDMVANNNNEVKLRMIDKNLLGQPNNVSQVGNATNVLNQSERVLQSTTSSQAEHATDLSNQPDRDFQSRNSSQASHTTNTTSDLVNTDDEDDDYPKTIGTSLRMLQFQQDQGASCVCCNSAMRSTVNNCVTCDGCQGIMHGQCAFRALEQEEFAMFCTSCSNGKRQYHKGLLDMKLSTTFGRFPSTAYTCVNDFKFSTNEKYWKNKITNFNLWLTTVDEIKYFTKKNGLYDECYMGRPKNDDRNKKEIYEGLIKTNLFDLFPNELCRIKMAKNNWFELSPEVKEFIRLHGMCYSNDVLFDTLFHTESQEWRYIKYNTWNQSSIIPEYRYKIIDDISDGERSEGTAWLSLTNDTRMAAITIVPLYYLKRWEICCAKDRVPGSRTEYDNVLLAAKDFANTWIEISQGRSKQNYFNDSINIHHLPKSFRIQRSGENSCVFNSLGNALHYINDYRGRDAVFDHLNKSLDYSEYREVAKTRKSFAAYVMNFCVKGYNAKLLTDLDVLKDRTMWPTLCILKGDDNSTNHAVTIVEDYIFDSNNSYALPLNESSLNWCCSGDDLAGSEVKFVSVPFAYRFYIHNPLPQRVLRHGNKNTFGVQAVIRSLLEINDTSAASSLVEYKSTVTPDQNVIAEVKGILHSSVFQYVPVKLKDVNDILLQSCSTFPTMFLLHLKDTFYYAIFSSVGNQYYDGFSEESHILTFENLCNSLVRRNEAEFSTISASRLVILKGYVFTKREKTSLKRKRSKVGNM